MSLPFVPGVGAVFNADVAVPDRDRAAQFYARVLGTGANSLWREADLMNNLGMPIIGLGERTPEHAHLPLQWMPHIQVADVAASARRSLALGGSELMHARSEGGESQWAVLLDPAGAAFGIIPVVPAEAMDAGDAPRDASAPVGRIAWLDLTVPDARAARDFYREVVGWPVQTVEVTDGEEGYVDYNLLGEDGSPAAGVCHARGVNAGLPPVWIIYLSVGDLEESLRRVEEEGGAVIQTVRRGDDAYSHAVVRDPVGACLGLTAG